MVVVIKKRSKKKDLEKLLNSNLAKPRKVLDAKKFCGVIKLKEDPVKIQRRLRNEWK
ncbi:MAG: hypothetical protein IPL53_01505 [Ignavibacteria bacterium]|nr:hypothetical protein [Ignavibacteria bacterium]